MTGQPDAWRNGRLAALRAALRRLAARRGDRRGGVGLTRALLLSAVVLFALLGWAVRYLYGGQPYGGSALSLDQVGRLAAQQQIVSATFFEEDSVVAGTACAVPAVNRVCPPGQSRQWWADYLHSDIATPALLDALQQHATVSVDHQSGKAFVRFATQFVLPLMLLANLFGLIFVARSGQGSLGDVAGFGSIGRRRSRRLRLGTGVTFADVAGADEAVTELREVVDYLVDPEKYRAMGAQPPKGVLLYGPPGCGKTLLARAVAGEAGVPFFAISGAEFVESLVGVGAARVRDLFRQARREAPAIVFIDEIDAAGRRRGAGGSAGGTDEREQTLNQMLVAMDGFEVSSGIVVMGATNRPDILDPALLRPGRFDRHVTVDEPDVVGRRAILQLHARDKPMAMDADLDVIARRTPGFTGADLANVINEAALLALREGHAEVRMSQLTEAIQRVLHGPRKRGHLLSVGERRRIAIHESGHALVAAAVGRISDVARISVVARGRGLGSSVVSGQSDRLVHTRSELEDEMAIAMGGLAAEEVLLGEPSTGAEDDVEKVTGLARQIAGRYGMSPALGPVRILARDTDSYLGAEAAVGDVSGDLLREFDQETRRLVEVARSRAADILTGVAAQLERLAATLEGAETLEGPELEGMLLDALPAGEVLLGTPLLATPPDGMPPTLPAAT